MHRIIIVSLLFLSLATAPVGAAPLATLHIFTVNDHGAADLLPTDRGQAVIELRSDTPRTVVLAIGVPVDLIVLGARASAGTVAIDDRFSSPGPLVHVHWSGSVSAATPINILVFYQVAADAAASDVTIEATGTLEDVQRVDARSAVRICCVRAPPPVPPPSRIYLPVIRR